MALPTASDNAFPSFLVTEGSAPSSPAAGKQRLFVDTSDHLLKLKNSGGTVTAVGSGGSGTLTTVEEADGSPTDSAVTKIVMPNGWLAIASHIATVTPVGSGIAYKYYTGGAVTTSSTSLVDADATNLAVAFTVPSTGNVLIRLSARTACGTNGTGSAGDHVDWGIRESTSIIAGPFLVKRAAVGPGTTIEYAAASVAFPITGLTPGAAKTYKWAFLTSNGSGQAQIQAASAEPAVMEVIVLP